ncbi:MAG: hypothetical protein K6T88_04100 [Bacillus sp. (in: Bacteria)]|nr:hypothetical protein [Bacillus sp. (in: firmicutes)]
MARTGTKRRSQCRVEWKNGSDGHYQAFTVPGGVGKWLGRALRDIDSA